MLYNSSEGQLSVALHIVNDLSLSGLSLLQVLRHRITTLLQAGRNVVLVGDLNIAPHMLDHCDRCYKVAPNAKAQFLLHRPDSQWFQHILVEGGGPLIDVFRKFHSDRCDCSFHV